MYKIITVPQSDLSSIGDIRILPPVGFTGTGNNAYSVKVKGVSTTRDSSHTSSVEKTVKLSVLEVAKAYTIKRWTDEDSDGIVDDGELSSAISSESTVDLGNLVVDDVSGARNDYISIPIEVAKVGGNDVVTVMVTGLPSDDYAFRLGTDYTNSTVAGARNETGEVVLFQLTDFNPDDGNANNNLNLFVDYTAWAALSNQGKITNVGDGDVNDDGAADYFSQLSLNLTAFAVDGSGFGTTAQTAVGLGLKLKSNSYPGDPIIIDYTDNGLADNFASSATAGLIDLNNDGTKDNVYWLTGNSGILVYDVSEGNSLLADTLTMKDNIFSEYFELDINNDGTRF